MSQKKIEAAADGDFRSGRFASLKNAFLFRLSCEALKLFFSTLFYGGKFKLQSLRNPFAVSLVGKPAMGRMKRADGVGDAGHCAGRVGKEPFLLCGREKPEEISRLRVEVIVVFAEIVMLRSARKC